jgi:hypothetical protein
VKPWRAETIPKSCVDLLQRTDRAKEAEALESQVGTSPGLKKRAPADGPRPAGSGLRWALFKGLVMLVIVAVPGNMGYLLSVILW